MIIQKRILRINFLVNFAYERIKFRGIVFFCVVMFTYDNDCVFEDKVRDGTAVIQGEIMKLNWN
jgi:hypothetical protein